MGNLEARRDWGYAPDYVRAMWMMLQQDEADDYAIGTGEAHSVRDFVEVAFARVWIWIGKSLSKLTRGTFAPPLKSTT